MAEDKKSFILYADLIFTVRKLSDENAGKLFKHILAYVNDENPTPENDYVDLSFEPIKQQLKRDLAKWEKFREKQSENGKRGGRPKKPNKSEPLNENPKNPSLLNESQKSLNVNDNVIVNANDSVNVNEVFSRRLLESQIDLEAIQVSTRIKVTKKDTQEFIAHLINEGKEHIHYNEWKKHLRNWLTKRPEINNLPKTTNQEPPKYKRL